MYNLNPVAQLRQQLDIVDEKKLYVSDLFAKKMEFKSKITIVFSSRKKFLLKIFKLGQYL